MIRHVTERDYGVDCIVEIALARDKDFIVSGQMFAIQAKSTKRIAWRGEAGQRRTRVSGLKVSTVNYWMKLPMPVFLCLHEGESDRVFFVDIKRFVRRKYPLLTGRKTVPCVINEYFAMNSDEGMYWLIRLFNMESSFEHFAGALTFLLTHQMTFELHRERHQQAAAGKETDDASIAIMLGFLRACCLVAQYLMVEWKGPTVHSIWAREGERFRTHQMLESTIAWAYEELRAPYAELVAEGRRLVTEEERAFWLFREPFFVRACYSPEQRAEIERRRAEARARGL